MDKIIVASSKGGVGKTTVSLGIASAATELGKKVLLCDLDFENRCLDLFMGIENVPLYNIFDVAKGRVPAEKAVIKNNRGLFFAAAPADASVGESGEKNITPDELVSALEGISEASGADMVICDTSAEHAIPSILAKSFANKALVVTSHQPAAQRGAMRMAGILSDFGIDTRLIITAFEFKETLHKSRAGLLDIIDGSGVQLLGAVPYDRELMLCHEKGVMAPRGSEAERAFLNIARRLCGESIRLFDGIKSIKRSKIL